MDDSLIEKQNGNFANTVLGAGRLFTEKLELTRTKNFY